jgi:preprotein translocase subunit SecA
MRIFGSDRLSNIMLKLGMEEGQEIEHPLVSRAIASAQKKVENHNFDIRKHLLEYDEVMNKQREYIYHERDTFLKGDLDAVINQIYSFIPDVAAEIVASFLPPKGSNIQDVPFADIEHHIQTEFNISFNFSQDTIQNFIIEQMPQEISQSIQNALQKKLNKYPKEVVADMERFIAIQTIDERWKEHLLEMDHLKEGISFQYLAQKNPLTEYKFKGFEAFENMIKSLKKEILSVVTRVEIVGNERSLFEEQATELEVLGTESHSDFDAYSFAKQQQPAAAMAAGSGTGNRGAARPASSGIRSQKINRNDPCPCGSGKKYKHCCGS